MRLNNFSVLFSCNKVYKNIVYKNTQAELFNVLGGKNDGKTVLYTNDESRLRIQGARFVLVVFIFVSWNFVLEKAIFEKMSWNCPGYLLQNSSKIICFNTFVI